MDTLETLLQYSSVRGVLHLCAAVLFIIAGFLVVVTALHTLTVLGKRTILYQKRRPAAGWNKRFYPAAILLILVVILLAFALRWFTANAHLL